MQQDVQAEVRRLQQLERTEVPAGRCRVETGPEFTVDLGPIDSWLYAAAFFRRMPTFGQTHADDACRS